MAKERKSNSDFFLRKNLPPIQFMKLVLACFDRKTKMFQRSNFKQAFYCNMFFSLFFGLKLQKGLNVLFFLIGLFQKKTETPLLRISTEISRGVRAKVVGIWGKTRISKGVNAKIWKISISCPKDIFRTFI